MNYLTRAAAIERMNGLAGAGKDFVFVVDYAMRQAIVLPFDCIDRHQFRFDFRGIGNDTAHSDAGDAAPRWDIVPPDRGAYALSFERVCRHLHLGNSFLVNLTCRFPLSTDLSLPDIYHRARAPYRLWLRDRLVCFSPEPFVRISDGHISSFPMKGTIDATVPNAEAQLLADKKEAAEHATIVDLIRNDLSMVAHQVRVCRYRYVERVDTSRGALLQTSSEITGTLPPDWRQHVGDILFSQLPAGSITGAPKPKTVSIIAEAENCERGFYTGVMGCFCQGRIDSSVMIRFVEEADGQLYYKAGGGLTAMSRLEDEYQEVIAKAYVPIR